MKTLRQLRWLIPLVVLALPFPLFADEWVQTDWSGGDGSFQYQDPSGYWAGSGVNGWRNPGSLLLFAPDFGKFVSIGSPGSAYGIYGLFSDASPSCFYVGTGEDTAEVFISRDFGATWDTTALLPQQFPLEVNVLYATKLGYLFAGSTPARIYRTHASGDSVWETVHTIHSSQGTVSNFAEVDFNLYATTVRATNDQAKVYKSDIYGSNWNESPEQPEIGGISPAAIYGLVLSEDSSFFAAAYYTNYGARIFRYLSTGTDWELCSNLPDTAGKPFGLDMGYDTLGIYGSLYVGMGEDSARVFRSDDQGGTWTPCGGLENARLVEGIVVDRDGTIYAACQTKRGLNDQVKVFRSTDMGTSWDTSAAIGSSATNKPTSFHQTDKGFLLVGTAISGEIFKAAYTDSGFLESSVLDVGSGNGSSEFNTVWWSVNLNGQQLGIKVRTGSDSMMSNAAPWHLCPFATNGQDLSDLASVWDGHRYIQYRAEFETNAIDYSARLNQIIINYSVDSTAPRMDTVFASDGVSPGPGIDADDYVMIVFDDSTNTPAISPATINSALKLNNGHSWWDDNGFVYAEWLSAESLRIWWPGLVGSPTVAVGDTIYPDSSTIADRWGNGCRFPAEIAGSFDPPGIGEEGSVGPHADNILIFPSVINKRFTASLDLAEDAHVQMALFDLSGRFVCTLFERQLCKGRNNLTIAARQLPAGIYFIKTLVNQSYTIEKITIVR